MLKMWFSDSVDLITCKSIKISISKIWPKNNTFSIITWVRESKKWFGNFRIYFPPDSFKDLFTFPCFYFVKKLSKSLCIQRHQRKWNLSSVVIRPCYSTTCISTTCKVINNSTNFLFLTELLSHAQWSGKAESLLTLCF